MMNTIKNPDFITCNGLLKLFKSLISDEKNNKKYIGIIEF